MTTMPSTSTGHRQVSGLRRFARYYAFSLGTVVRDWAFLAFVILMPVTMYVFFTSVFGDSADDSVTATMMIMMATYGGLGAAMNAGASIQSERSSGWFRNLMLTPLNPAEFVGAKVCTAVTVVIPALGTVFVAGFIQGVRLPMSIWAAMLALLLLALLPMVLMGLVIGLWFKPQTATAVTTLSMLALSMLGGLWIPLEAMPAGMQSIGRLLPSHWAAQIGSWPLAGGGFPWDGVQVIAVWALALIAVGALGYRRAIRTSRR